MVWRLPRVLYVSAHVHRVWAQETSSPLGGWALNCYIGVCTGGKGLVYAGPHLLGRQATRQAH